MTGWSAAAVHVVVVAAVGDRSHGELAEPVVEPVDACTAVVGSRNGESDSDRSAMSTSIRNP